MAQPVMAQPVITQTTMSKKNSAKPPVDLTSPLTGVEISAALRKEAAEILAEQRKLRVQAFLEEKTERSAQVIHELLDNEDTAPVVRFSAAKDILDRGGFKPVERLAIAQVVPITGMKFVLDGE